MISGTKLLKRLEATGCSLNLIQHLMHSQDDLHLRFVQHNYILVTDHRGSCRHYALLDPRDPALQIEIVDILTNDTYWHEHGL